MPDKNKRQKRLDNGYCGTCGVYEVVDFTTCDRCKETVRRNHRLRIVERKRDGLCTTCGKNKSVYGMKTCQRCRDEHSEKWIKNGEEYKRKDKISRQKLKRYVMDKYGGCCVCCGESGLKFLTIDHVNNDGKEHRKQGVGGGDNIYRWLRSSGFPEGFQTLCYNCNIGRYRNNGICPHKDVSDGV